MPLGQWMFGRVGKVVALFPPKNPRQFTDADGTVNRESRLKQRSLLVRGLYFFFIGWWFSLIWLQIAYLLTLSIILWPFGYLMLPRTGTIMTLQRI